MKKVYLVSTLIIILVISFFIGYYIYKITQLNTNFSVFEGQDECTEFAHAYELGLVANQANGKEIKVSPNAMITKKIYYKDCGHTINQYDTAEDPVVNLNKEELQERYQDWKIEEFSERKVILSKEEEGNCKQHYILREKDGNIAVYVIDESGKETLTTTTTIATEYLTETDRIKIKEGIRANGMEELNSTLEDFE